MYMYACIVIYRKSVCKFIYLLVIFTWYLFVVESYHISKGL